MRALMMGPIYGTTADSFVPGFLMSSFGTTPYLTQSFNNWLLGWHDPVSAFLATGNPMDTSVGWTSLESNETYFSSDVLNGGVAIANGDGTNYTMCTGEVDTCDKGETLAEDGSTQLSWRNDAMMTATFGLITPESLVGTTGGFLTGTDDKVDVSGYAIADITCDGTSEVKGIPVDASDDDITSALAGFGAVSSVSHREGRDFAFAVLDSADALAAAIAGSVTVGGQSVVVEERTGGKPGAASQ